MSGSLNRVQLIGNLGRDPEARSLGNGGRVVTLSVATSENWRDKSTGERRERTEWHKVIVWVEPLGQAIEKYCVKGSKVFVEGQLRTRSYEDPEGVTRYVTEIHLTPFNGTITFLDSKRENSETSDVTADWQSAGKRQNPRATAAREQGWEIQETVGAGAASGGLQDDDIPF
jgi:single-strand DNA-binding protein